MGCLFVDVFFKSFYGDIVVYKIVVKVDCVVDDFVNYGFILCFWLFWIDGFV